MIFELRTYDARPGRATAYLEAFRTRGVSLVTRHLPMAGYWMVETGRLNRIEHLWVYEDFAERDACRAGLSGEPEWVQGFVPEAFVDIVAQQTRFLELVEGSGPLDRVVADRRTGHPLRPHAEPMFAPSLHALSFRTTQPDPAEGRIGLFRTLSGEAPGDYVALDVGDFPALAVAARGASRHQVLRPLSLSPLQ